MPKIPRPRRSTAAATDEHRGTACADNADRIGDTDTWRCRICGTGVQR